MLIITHVLIALSSVTSSIYLFFRPKKRNFNITYLLIGSTFITGTYLVITTHSSISHACIAGIVYLLVVMAGVIPAQIRLKKMQAQKEYIKTKLRK